MSDLETSRAFVEALDQSGAAQDEVGYESNPHMLLLEAYLAWAETWQPLTGDALRARA